MESFISKTFFKKLPHYVLSYWCLLSSDFISIICINNIVKKLLITISRSKHILYFKDKHGQEISDRILMNNKQYVTRNVSLQAKTIQNMNKDGLLIIVSIKTALWVNMRKYIVIYPNTRISSLHLKYHDFKKRVPYQKKKIIHNTYIQRHHHMKSITQIFTCQNNMFAVFTVGILSCINITFFVPNINPRKFQSVFISCFML